MENCQARFCEEEEPAMAQPYSTINEYGHFQRGN